MTITQLQYFQAVCQSRNIKTASDLLHVSQPAVSSSLRELEQELKLNLFRRTSKGTYPTEDALKFLKYVDEFLFNFDRLKDVACDISKAHNKLRCGASPMLGSCILPEIYNVFRNRHPEVEIDICTEEGVYPLYDMLARDELDVLLVPGLNIPDIFNTYTLRNERLWFCVHSEHRLAKRETLTPTDIFDTPMVILPPNYVQCKLVEELFSQYKVKPNILLYTKQLSVIRNFIIAGTAAGFFYESYIERNFRSDELAMFDIGMPIIPFSLVWKKEGYLFSSTQKFIDIVKAFYQT